MNKRNLKNNIKEFFVNIKKFFKANNKVICVILLLLVLLFNFITCIGSFSSHRTASASPIDNDFNYYYKPSTDNDDPYYTLNVNGVESIDDLFKYCWDDGEVFDYGDVLFQTIDLHFPFCDITDDDYHSTPVRLQPVFPIIPITFVYLASNNESYDLDGGQDRGYVGFLIRQYFYPFVRNEDGDGYYSADIQLAVPYRRTRWFTADDNHKGDNGDLTGQGSYPYYVQYSFVVRFPYYDNSAESLEEGFQMTSTSFRYIDDNPHSGYYRTFSTYSISYSGNNYANAVARYSATQLEGQSYGFYRGSQIFLDYYYLSCLPPNFTPSDTNSYNDLYIYMSQNHIISISVSFNISMIGYNPKARVFVGGVGANERINGLSNFRFDDYYQSTGYFRGPPLGVDFSLLSNSQLNIIDDSYDLGFNDGFNDGYADGLVDGRLSGFEEGKIIGADLSIDEALATVNPFKRIQVWVDSLMNTELFPNVSLKLLFMFAIGMFLLIVIIKTFLGG